MGIIHRELCRFEIVFGLIGFYFCRLIFSVLRGKHQKKIDSFADKASNLNVGTYH